MDSDVSEIKSKLNIVDVLGEYIRLEKAGSSWRSLCPFHNEKSPSFMVSEEKQIWYCFGCQKGGDVFSFLMEMEGMEFREALKVLAEKSGVQLKNFSPQNNEKKDRIFEILEISAKFYEVQLWKGEEGKNILKYLKERGLDDSAIKEFRLGYAPKGWRNILNFLLGRGYKIEEIERTGLLVKKEDFSNENLSSQNSNFYDRFRDRIIFPIADYSGKVLGYSARVSPGQDEKQAKYVNTPETNVYHKGNVLYGIDKAKNEIKKKNSVLLVEGNMDVIASSQAGIRNVVAVSGTALTEQQVKIIKRYTNNINIFFDMDSAGELATKKSVKLCLANDMSVKVVSLLKGKDAADLAKENPKALINSVENSCDFMDYFWKNVFNKFDKDKVSDKKKITEEILDIISSFKNEVEKSYWIKKTAEELGVAESALTDMFKRLNLKGKDREEALEEKVSLEKILTKKEILTRELIGLMSISSDVWREAVKNSDDIRFFSKSNFLDLMFEKGEEFDFNLEVFINKALKNQDDRTKLENIFFQKKYQLNLNNGLEEVFIADPLGDFRVCFNEIKKEAMKKKLSLISFDLKLAEEKKDREAILFLRKEFDKISKDLGKFS